jgi:hypothetical protein
MAKKHLTRINKLIAQLEKIQTEVDALRDELQDKFDNMSESSQESDYGDDLQDAIDSLDNASFDGIETALDELRNAVLFMDSDASPLPIPEEEEDIDIDISLPLSAGLMYGAHKLSEKHQDHRTQDSSYNPYDNHWETSFDWIDEDNDGYDDRDDGFLG